MMESGTVWRASIQSLFKIITELRDTAQFYSQLYGHKEKCGNNLQSMTYSCTVSYITYSVK